MANPIGRSWSLTARASAGAALVLGACLGSMLLLRGVTAQALLQVRQAGQAVDTVSEVRDLHAPVMRLLAYAQLVYQGDRTFHEALTSQIDVVDQAFGRLAQQVGIMAPAQWSLFKQAQADWNDTRSALQELLPAGDAAMEQRLNLRESLRTRSASLQRTLESLERESQEQRALLTTRAAGWAARADHVAAVLVGLWLVGSLALWLLVRRRMLRPLEQVALAAEALSRGDLGFRMQPLPGTGNEPLAASFNAMVESLQRAQEHASL